MARSPRRISTTRLARPPRTPGNRLLALLMEADFAALEPHLEPYPLKKGVTLLRPNVPVKVEGAALFLTPGALAVAYATWLGKGNTADGASKPE